MSWKKPLEAVGGVLLGLLVALLALEGGLRLVGFVLKQRQEWANQAALSEGRDIRVICIGESTTAIGGAFSYPQQLEIVLTERKPGPSFSVVNLGRLGADSSILLADLQEHLDRYRPHVVVAMMGANDVIGTPGQGAAQPKERAIPDLGVPLAERTGPATWFKTWRLVELLSFHLGKSSSEVAAPEASPPPPPPPPTPERKQLHLVPGGSFERPAIEVLSPRLLAFYGLDPASRPPVLTRAWRAAEQGDFDAARAHFRQALRENPDSERVSLELALHLDRQDRPADALERAAAVAEDSPLAPLARWLEARIHATEGRCPQAAAALEVAVAGDPTLGHGFGALATCRFLAGHEQQAYDTLERALGFRYGIRFIPEDRLLPFAEETARGRDPMRFQPPYDKGSLSYELERLYAVADASEDPHPLVAQLARHTSINPQDQRGVAERLVYLEARGDPDRVRAEIERLESSGTNKVGYAGIALYYLHAGDDERAREYLMKAGRYQDENSVDMTRKNYRRLQEIAEDRHMGLVVVQYPTLPLEPLRTLIDWDDDVEFVDNEQVFFEAIREEGYDALFLDRCYGSFGHGTPRGNRLLAENVADAVLRAVR